jgi:hypothetical protein
VRLRIGLASLVLLAGLASSCAPSGDLAVSPSARPSETQTGPTPISSPTSAVALTCRLPVIVPAVPGVPPGGWISFPEATFERDPASLPGRLQAHVPSYDRAIHRWLPVEYKYVAPDGLSYILTGDPVITSPEDPAAFYLVDVKTGKRHQVLSAGPPAAPGSWQVIDYSSEGVYLWSAGISPVPGLWLLNPGTRVVRLIDGHRFWNFIGGGSAWAASNDPSVSGPAASGSLEVLYRLDLQTSREETWLQANAHISLLAANPDGGALIALVQPDGSEQLGLVSAPGTFQRLDVPLDFPVVDAAYVRHPGIWLALRGGGLALYTRPSGIQWLTRGDNIFDVAGGCW